MVEHATLKRQTGAGLGVVLGLGIGDEKTRVTPYVFLGAECASYKLNTNLSGQVVNDNFCPKVAGVGVDVQFEHLLLGFDVTGLGSATSKANRVNLDSSGRVGAHIGYAF